VERPSCPAASCGRGCFIDGMLTKCKHHSWTRILPVNSGKAFRRSRLILQFSYSRKCSINAGVSFLVLVTGTCITAALRSCGQLTDQFVFLSCESQSRMWCIMASRSGPLLGCISDGLSFRKSVHRCADLQGQYLDCADMGNHALRRSRLHHIRDFGVGLLRW
jgi:hypothetical protein